LNRLCEKIGHGYVAHNALEDAMAAAALYLTLVQEQPARLIGVGGGSGSQRSFRNVPSSGHARRLVSNPDGRFFKTWIVLTGDFSAPRDDKPAFERYLAEQLGFAPRSAISGKTKILVTGNNPGPSKIEKARQKGIEIMSEEEFLSYINSEGGR
jgi:NAD-dependent DNA ligase